MLIQRVRSIVAALVMSSMAIGSAVQPARADTTTTLIITAAAAIGLMTAINVAEKNAKAHQVVGYLPNGSTVYADGHVVATNGQTWYPGNYGENIACNGQQCYVTGPNGIGYGPNTPPYGNGYPNGYGAYPTGYGGYPSGYGGYPSGYGGYPNGYGAGYPSGYGGSYPSGYGNGYPSGYGNGYPSGYGSYPSGYGTPTYPLPPAPSPRTGSGEDRDNDAPAVMNPGRATRTQGHSTELTHPKRKHDKDHPPVSR